jgi:2-succinyl-5-enolpyruvyl-6-hydroxy-3-cyclohexene-1-carboxylate synthase
MKINRNFFISQLFAEELSKCGIKNCCISPGSRNTPLTAAFALQKQISKFVCVDERSSAFFALGLTQASKLPTVIICTSGTAVAEFYPAIIEAYKNNFPLIVITADRPKGMSEFGANQTINQIGIYKNHIQDEYNIDAAVLDLDLLKYVKDTAYNCFWEASYSCKPVHINFHFDKPLEPDAYTDEISDLLAEQITAYKHKVKKDIRNESGSLGEFASIFQQLRKGLIIAGSELFEKEAASSIYKFSELSGYPILAEVTSNLKKKDCKTLVTNIDSFLEFYNFPFGKPEIIIHFGKSVFSKGFDNFLKNFNGKYYQVNTYSSLFDPFKKVTQKIKMHPHFFCEEINSKISGTDSKEWLNDIVKFDGSISVKLTKKLAEIKQPYEGSLYRNFMKCLPDKCSIFLSNSLPIRDFNNFAGVMPPGITIYNNRGAAGIDGIIGTAAGICKQTKHSTILITGDLAFYYDINSLLTAKKYNIPLVILLVNNNGGGIFNTLPIAGNFNEFEDYFTAPLNLNFKKIVEGFGGNYTLLTSINNLKWAIEKALKLDDFSVIEFKTNSTVSSDIKKSIISGIKDSTHYAD